MIRKLSGMLMISAGAMGLVISVIGLVLIQQTSGYVQEMTGEEVIRFQETPLTLLEAIDIASESAQNASDALGALEETTLSMADVVSNTQPSLAATRELITKEVPESLQTIQAALPTLQTAAEAVDETLRQVSEFESLFIALGLISSSQINYDPETSLADSVATLEGSLEGIPERLESLDPVLNQFEQDMDSVYEGILMVSTEIKALNADLERLVQLTENLEATSQDLDTLIRIARPIATFLLIWLAVSQLAPIYIGFVAIRSAATKHHTETR